MAELEVLEKFLSQKSDANQWVDFEHVAIHYYKLNS